MEMIHSGSSTKRLSGTKNEIRQTTKLKKASPSKTVIETDAVLTERKNLIQAPQPEIEINTINMINDSAIIKTYKNATNIQQIRK